MLQLNEAIFPFVSLTTKKDSGDDNLNRFLKLEEKGLLPVILTVYQPPHYGRFSPPIPKRLIIFDLYASNDRTLTTS